MTDPRRGKPSYPERLALEVGPCRWDLDIRQWSREELAHARDVIREEIARRQAVAATREGVS